MNSVGERIREQFFALRGVSGTEAQQLRAAIEQLDAAPTTQLHGLSVSYFPTVRFKQLRFVDAAELPEGLRALFARPCVHLPELAAVFVDPEELSYRSFENLLSLDRLFTGLGSSPIRFAPPTPLAGGVSRLSSSSSSPLHARLMQLDSLGLYARPLHAALRGGQRFIFHCAELAAALTAALREALPEPMLTGFVHVNPVFRCNRFESGDPRFVAHMDSPYYDRSRHHVSKYTLLIYLTGGRGEALLRFGDELVIDEIEPMTAFVFEQHLEHEGGPYADGHKLFLRTELIFEDSRIEHAPGVAQLFAKACYLDCESLFAPELSRLAHAAYDRAAAAHWRGLSENAGSEPFMLKQFRGTAFVTNGYDYWFHKGEVSLIECAALALLDLLNAKVGGKPFRALCTTEVLVRAGEPQAWLAEVLRTGGKPAGPVFASLDKPALFPAPEEPLKSMGFPGSPDFSEEPYPEDWDATRHPRVVDVYSRAQRFAMKRIFSAPLTILGQEVFLDPGRFVVEADKIHVLSSERLGPLHFAGARFLDPEDFIDVDVSLDTLQPLVPPIHYRESGELLHLACDLFRNSWMVSHRSEQVPVPRVMDSRDTDPPYAAWHAAAAKGCHSNQKQLRAELESEAPRLASAPPGGR
jgi:hypothetical protein